MSNFFCRDPTFLKNYPDENEETLFEWNLKPKHEIVPDENILKLTQYKMELKLKKAVVQMWTTISSATESLGIETI